MPDRDAGGPEHRPDRLALLATRKISEYGFVTTPYRVVKDGKITDEIVHLDATEEQERLIAQANEPLDDDGALTGDSDPLPHAGGAVRLRRRRARST